jgi:hypothetical protein
MALEYKNEIASGKYNMIQFFMKFISERFRIFDNEMTLTVTFSQFLTDKTYPL